MTVALVAFGAVSALGAGVDAVSAGHEGEAPRVAIARDPELEAAGLARPFCARAAVDGDGDRAARILASAFERCARALDEALPGWRGRRVGLAIGTSSGGMRTAEGAFAAIARGEPLGADRAARAAYFGPLLDVARDSGLAFAPASLVLCACASSVIAVGLGKRWLEADRCDLVLAGGFDAVATFVAAGFESLQATSARVPPRPFRVGRDGMALGEGAAVLALARPRDVPRPLGYVTGFGASADAVHLTAPDRTGDGLARAASAALAEAGVGAVDLVSAHATSTPFNDAAEAKAIARVAGERAHVHAFKAQIGHTLGAAGGLEALAALDAIARGVLPATAGEGELDPEAPARLADRAARGTPRVALKLASAFGGANAALVVSADPSPAAGRPLREAWITRAARVVALPGLAELAADLGVPADKLARADGQCLAALAALARLRARVGPIGDAGIIVGTAAATFETNARFAARLRERGPRFVEPRRFPYTSPNAVAGECGVAFGLRGPAFSVGAGLHAGLEALAVATDLVRAGDAHGLLVVAVDDVGDAVRAWSEAVRAPLVPGAVALLVTSDRHPASVARVVEASLSLCADDAGPEESAAPGHLALAPLDADRPPLRLAARSLLLGVRADATVTLAPA